MATVSVLNDGGIMSSASSCSLRDIPYERILLPGRWKRFAAQQTLSGLAHRGQWALNYQAWRAPLDTLGSLVPHLERAVGGYFTSALYEYYDSSQQMKVKRSALWPSDYERFVLVRIGRHSGRPVGVWHETPLAVPDSDFVEFTRMDDAAVVLTRDACEREGVCVGCPRIANRLYARTLLLYLFMR